MNEFKRKPKPSLNEAKQSLATVNEADSLPLPSETRGKKVEYKILSVSGPSNVIEDIKKAARSRRLSYWEYIALLMDHPDKPKDVQL